MVVRRLPAELADIVRRAAHYPHGLGFLHHAWVDSVAVTLGVHPFAVDATRAYLDTERGRTELLEAVHREQARTRTPPRCHGPDRRTLHQCEERARALIETARRDARGLDYLGKGQPDDVAERFHVHPYLVFRARGMLERDRRREEAASAVARD